MDNRFYKKEVKLLHHESPAKYNHNTGEFSEVTTRSNNMPEDKEIFNPDGKYAKFYNHSLDYLLEVLNPLEFKIVGQMIFMASMRSNSLRPLNDNTTITELASTFHIHRNSVKKIFSKLYNHGIYAEFDFAKAPLSFDPNDPSTFDDSPNKTKYWVLNPFIVFRGRTIDTALTDLFRNVKITKYVFAKMNDK